MYNWYSPTVKDKWNVTIGTCNTTYSLPLGLMLLFSFIPLTNCNLLSPLKPMFCFLNIFISFFALIFEFLGRLQLLQSLHASFGIGEGNVSTTYLSLPLLAKLESHIITDILLGQAIAKRGKFTRSRYVKIRYAKITVGTKTCLGMSRQD